MTGSPRGEAGLLDEAWSGLVMGSGAVPERPALELGPPGAEPGLPSRLRADEAAVASVGTALLAACALASTRRKPAVTGLLHPAHAGAAVTSERHFRVAGRPASPGFAPLSRFWRTSDGWLRTHANYPWHRDALLAAVGTDEDPQRVGAAIARLPGTVIEERVVANGGVAAAVRTLDEWSAHPQGLSVASEPLIAHRVVPGAAARGHPAGAMPASGVRVLDMTRVIAGPVCTRYLGALGATVLRIDPPSLPDMPTGAVSDTLLAKRSAALDLGAAGSTELLHELLGESDVLVCGYRPGSLDRFGLGPDALAARHAGLVVVYLSAWGHSGPWAARRGFDSVVQAPTGIASAEGDGAVPGALPCQLLDHATGYLAAAAALDGLRRQTVEGGTHVRRLSLARTAWWLTSAGVAPAPERESDAEEPGRWLARLGTDPAVTAVAPPGSVGGRRLEWPSAPARYLADTAAW